MPHIGGQDNRKADSARTRQRAGALWLAWRSVATPWIWVLWAGLGWGAEAFDPTRIQLPGAEFRTEETPPRPGARMGGPELFVVQLAAPVHRQGILELQQSLEKIGGRLVAPLGSTNYIVWSTAETIEKLREAQAVRWASAYASEWKIPAELRQAKTSGSISVVRYDGTRLTRERLAAGKVEELAERPDVLALATLSEKGSIRDEMSDQIATGKVEDGEPRPGYRAFLEAKGVDGSGVTVGIVDEGSTTVHPELRHGSPGCLDYKLGIPPHDCGQADVRCGYHGTWTAGIVAADGSSGVGFDYDGELFVKGLGVAPGANILSQNFLCVPGQGAIPPQSPIDWLQLSQDQVRAGAYISANSWGPASTPKGYDWDTSRFDLMPRDGDPETTETAEPVVFSLSIMNGGGGTSTQGTPDEGKNLIRVGATRNRIAGEIDDLCSCTAHGPALDGRRLPDLVAPGMSIHSTAPPDQHTDYAVTGTSFASPHVSGAAALIVSWFQGDPSLGYRPSPALIKAILVGTADDLYGGHDADGNELGHRPDDKQGWGRLNLNRAVRPKRHALFFDQAPARIFTDAGQQFTWQVHAQQPAEAMRVSLVWTDAPAAGLGGVSAAWVNDLDLSVSDQDATFLGNVFEDGWSATGGERDFKNNVENVFLEQPGRGDWTIQVKAAGILGDGVWSGAPSSRAEDFDQDFALYCYNCVPAGQDLGQPPSAWSLLAGLASIAALAGARRARRPKEPHP